MAQRIKGQETQVTLTIDGVPQVLVGEVRSFSVELQTEILTEGYLGETTNRKDSIFNGVSGSIELHISDQQTLRVFEMLVDKARRRTPGTLVNIMSTLSFPNGQRPRMLFPDVEFGALPLNFGSRSDYGTVTLTWEGSEFRVLY